MKYLATLAMVGLLAVMGCGDSKPSPSGGAGAPSAAAASGGKALPPEAAEEDKNCLEMLNEKGKVAEAREWLDPKHQNHMLWAGDRQELRDLFNALYDAGAPAVHAVDISDLSELTKQPGEMTALFVVTLPNNAGARDRVFRRLVEYWKPILEDAEPDDVKAYTPTDVGQGYYLLNLDL